MGCTAPASCRENAIPPLAQFRARESPSVRGDQGQHLKVTEQPDHKLLCVTIQSLS